MDPIEDMQCNIAQDLGNKSVPKEPEMEPEKVDLSPENSKKSDNSPTGDQISRQKLSDEADGGVEKVQYSNCNLHSGINECVNKSMSMQEVKEKQRCASEDPEVRNALAFTIDFGEGRKSVDVQRHEKMLERFQNRHKRGVSLSKLETTPSISSVGKNNIPQSANLPRKQKIISSDTPSAEVKLRDKNRSLRDSSSKRHSWSPRTSMAEASTNDTSKPLKSNKFTPKSSTLQMAFEAQNVVKDYCSSSEINAESLDSSIGLPCIEPPLQNFKSDDNDDSVSEAGTYTLDGDNYTEEQKERMNIDKIPAITETTSSHFFKSEHKPPQRPTNFQDDLEVIDLTEQSSSYKAPDDRKMNNVLEVSYFHDPMVVHPVKQKQSYLEKLKSRVKNITHKAKSPEKQIQQHQLNSPDQGTFTSVTTSGILSVKPSLEDHPRMHRRNSLTKSYVDSSEYVQGVAKLNILSKGEAKILNCYTDTEKASGVQDMYENSRRKTASDASVISSAVSKKDWIQEWAKTAREYSNSPAAGTSNNAGSSQMTRSYDFENRNQFGYDFDIDMTKSDYYDAKKYEEFGDNLDRYQFRNRKQLDHLISNNNNNNSSSDPTMKQNFSNENNSFNEFTRHGSIRQHSRANSSKPPMSPSKIPSPIGSVGRARSVSRNRSLQGSNSDLSTNETEMYLQKTAAAISTLQNIHRRNSIRSTTQQQQQQQHNSSHSSPLSPGSRRMSPKISPMNSFQSPVHNLYNDRALSIEGATLSPQHQQIRSIKHQQQQQQMQLNHKRNLSLDDSDSYVNVLSSLEYGNQMSNSLNADNANAILDFKKQHTRHNSFEGMSTLPPKPVKCFQNFDQTTAYYTVKSPNDAGMCDEDENDKHLLTLTTGVKGLSLGATKSNEHRIPKGSSPSVGKSTTIPMKAVGASSASRPVISKTPSNQMSSPIKRSSSFSVKAMKPTTPTLTPKLGSRAAMSNTKIQKSASSTSFKKIVANFKDDEDDFYINNDDDLELNPEYSSNSEFSDDTEETEKEPITNTRYNKTFLMRMEQNKKLSAAGKQGVAACPNTPELPRRTLQIKGATRDRASMPRDSSLNRMKQDLNISRKSVGKELAFKEQTPANKQKVQPKYLDISKYKTPSASNFLKKDESKSYLAKSEVKKSPSSASIALGRTEHNRMSTRSVKSAGAKLPNVKREAPRSSKEQELEMWRRRASYDPMKAAQEGKRKQEEAKRTAVASRQIQQQTPERPSNFNESSVLRSKSYHGGVGMAHSQHGSSSNTNTRGAIDHADMLYGSSQPNNNRWTFTSTESSEEYEDEYVN